MTLSFQDTLVQKSSPCRLTATDSALQSSHVHRDSDLGTLIHPLAVPRRGHVLSTVTELYSAPLRDAVMHLANALDGVDDFAALHQGLLGINRRRASSHLDRPPAELSAWALVAIWATAVATDALPLSATLADAEGWFFGDLQSERITDLVSTITLDKAHRTLCLHADPKAYRALLPYILDPHGPGSRLSVRRDPSTRAARACIQTAC